MDKDGDGKKMVHGVVGKVEEEDGWHRKLRTVPHSLNGSTST